MRYVIDGPIRSPDGRGPTVHEGGVGYEVEFIALDGETLAVTTLDADRVRPISLSFLLPASRVGLEERHPS